MAILIPDCSQDLTLKESCLNDEMMLSAELSSDVCQNSE